MPSKQFSDLCSALNAQEQGGEWVCRCPAHDDASPSLWLREQNEVILLHCFAGCSQSAVIDELRKRGLWSSVAAAERRTPPGIPYFWPPAAVLRAAGKTPSPENSKAYKTHWSYHNAEGDIIGHVVRYEGHGKKDLIPFFKRSGNQWRSGMGMKTGRPLFNLHRVKARNIYIVEGEKCAAELQKFLDSSYDKDSQTAITWLGGSSAVAKTDWTPLISHLNDNPETTVTIWPDKDAPGQKAAEKLIDILHAGSRLPIRVIDTEQFEADSGYDCADWVRGERSWGDLMDLKVLISYPPADNSPSLAESAPAPLNFSLTDLGNGDRFAAQNRDTARYVPGIGWHLWDGKIWAADQCAEALNQAGMVARKIHDEAAGKPEGVAKAINKHANNSQNVSKLKAMLEAATTHAELVADVSKFDSESHLLGCSNGVINLTTGELLPSDPKLMISKRVHIEYDREAKAPAWAKFLSDIMLGNLDMVMFLQRAIGYTLSGDCSEQKMFLCYGPTGSNGKTVFLETVAEMFGDYAANTPIQLFLLNNQGEEAAGSNSVARLRGARFVNGSEVPNGARLNEARIKELTGQDTISARFLYKEFFSFKPAAKFWIRSNYRPEISSQDGGIWRRIITIPFIKKILDHEKDFKLQDKLRAELPGILNWACEGYRAWRELGLVIPEQCLSATEDYKEDMDLLGAWITARCILDPNAETKASDLYSSYQDWCRGAGEKPVSMRRLMIRIKDRGHDRVHRADGRFYRGLSLRSDVGNTDLFGGEQVFF